jgi:hypothetical protein
VDFLRKQLVDISFCFKLAGALFFERLEKVKPIFELLQQTNNDWFYFACWQKLRINTNGEIFLKVLVLFHFQL